MNHQAFDILEFPALRALVRRNAQTEAARELIDQIEPVEDFARLQNDLKQLAEMIELRTQGIRVSFDGLVDTSESIARLRIEGTTLEPLALLDLAASSDRMGGDEFSNEQRVEAEVMGTAIIRILSAIYE